MSPFLSMTSARRVAGTTALALLTLAACGEVDRALAVTDPDIINPEDTQSPAAAAALRLGAIVRHNQATSGGESFWLLGGLMADEYRSGDTFVQRDQTDQRAVETNNGNVNTAFRAAHRARVAAQLAARALQEFEGEPWQIAEMYVLQAFHENQLTEHMCSGIPWSTINEEGVEVEAPASTAIEGYERALAHADSALALNTEGGDDSTRVANAAKVVKGRILLNLDRPADAAAAVAGVPTGFEIVNEHSETAQTNQMYALGPSAARWTVSLGEGTNGLNFGIGDPRVPVCKGTATATRHAPTNSLTGIAPCPTRSDYADRPFDAATPVALVSQQIWPDPGSPAAWVSGTEARLIEAEAQLAAGDASGALGTLNTLRATVTGLAPLTSVNLDTVFRERAFWLFSTGHRLGDLRRLVRNYGRTAESVFPTGEWYLGAPYGTDVNFPIPQSEDNNQQAPNASACIDRNA